MSANYVIIKNEIENNGIIAIEKNVFRDIVKNTLLEHEYTNLADAPLLGKSMTLVYDEETLTIDLDLKVKFGNRVIRVIEDIQKKIYDTLKQRTNVKSVIVNIGVVGFIF